MCLPKVRNLDCVVVDEEIFGFEISMHIVLFVHVGEALERLVHDVADEVFGEEFFAVFH